MRFLLFVLTIALLASACTKADDPKPLPTSPTISALNCSAATASAIATAGAIYAATVTVPYSGGNALTYSDVSQIASAGVGGLTAVLQPGTLANGAGNLSYSITGTPINSGVASFSISFGGQSCSFDVTVNSGQNFTQYGTPFANVCDRQDAVIYQVNMRAFGAQSNFQGVIARLDSIKALGVNVIYLMPIYPVGSVRGVNSPYCVKDYRGINTEFGNLTDLRALVDGAHSRNMSVILDWVANHTAWDNAWITAHKDWYLQDGAGTILSPPGTTWNDVAQLNFASSAMRTAMIENMKYWVYTANIDGFRCDYADGPPFDFWKQAIDELRAITTHKLLLLAEGTRSNHYTAGFDFTFGFNFFAQLKNIYSFGQSATTIDALNSSEYNGASNGQQVVRYLTNHDVNGSDGTPLQLFGGATGSMAAFIAVAYMKSVPMIYNGQEVGTPYKITFPFTNQDINWSLNPQITAEYKRVIAFRNASTAIRRGQLTSYSNSAICAFTKESGAERVFVMTNLRNATVTYALPSVAANATFTNAMTNATVALTNTIDLPPYSYLILRN